MTCLMTVRGSDVARQWTLDDWTALVGIAVLSAEPETVAEWIDAMRRYQPDHELEPTGQEIGDLDEAAGYETWCLLDLRSRTAVASADFDFPNPQGAYEPNEDEHADGFPIVWLDTPPDWQFLVAEADWQARIRVRTSERKPLEDHRAVLFGNPLFDYLAGRLVQLNQEDRNGDDKKRQKAIRQIHADWLMTARDDLQGRTPREILLADRDRIQMDLEHRSYQWTRQNKPTYPLSTESVAYRCGGFGTVEVVMYFDMIRAALHGAWSYLKSHEKATAVELSGELARHADTWLNNSYEDEKTTPAQMIESERRRIPATSQDSMFDCDCPICRAEAEGLFGSSPMFMWFDGHHLEMEGDFAFSLLDSRKEWESQQWDPRFGESDDDDEEQESESRLPQVALAHDLDDSQEDEFASSVWESSYVDWNQVAGPGSSTRQSLFALAFPVAELVSGLKQRPQGRKHMDTLNHAYDLLRQASDRDQAGTAAQQLCATLEGLCHEYPELTPRCADLQSHVDEVVRRFQL